jgi:hypothetical protein
MKVVIQHVPGRHDDKVAAVKEVFPDAVVVEDRGQGPMQTYIESLSFRYPHWHFEDDIVLAPDFRERAKDLVRLLSSHVIRGFCQKESQVGWRAGSTFVWTQCFWLPVNYGPQLAEFIPTWNRLKEHPTGFDYALADFLKSRKERYWSVQPSLCQHVEGSSALGARSSKRRSESFAKAYPGVV